MGKRSDLEATNEVQRRLYSVTTASNPKELLPTERVAYITFLLMRHRGQKFTTAEIAKHLSLKHNGAWKLMSKLSRVVPVVQDVDGWVIY